MFRVDSAAFARSLRQAGADLGAVAQQALGQAASFALALARNTNKFQDQTGRLRASLRRGTRRGGGYFVRAGDRRAPYAGPVEDGSKAHTITPRRGQFLRFVVNGQVRFARSVRHPGTKPTHFMLDARNASERQLDRFVQSGVARIFQ